MGFRGVRGIRSEGKQGDGQQDGHGETDGLELSHGLNLSDRCGQMALLTCKLNSGLPTYQYYITLFKPKSN